MTRCHVETTAAADLACKLPKLTASGGRMQMAYAVFPDIDGPAVVRYISSVSGKEDFVIWEVATNGMPLPSLASICPLLGWYEREIMELSGLAFTNHPEPERLVTAPRYGDGSCAAAGQRHRLVTPPRRLGQHVFAQEAAAPGNQQPHGRPPGESRIFRYSRASARRS